MTAVIAWRAAWQEALYGPAGFYRRPEGPAGHFTTSTHGELGAVFAQGIAALAEREEVRRVVDVGCGRGELLVQLHRLRPDLALLGVDVVERPEGLPEPIGWLRTPVATQAARPGGSRLLPEELRDLDDALVIAHEWLDVVPCTVAEVDEGGALRVALVDPATGEESLQGEPEPLPGGAADAPPADAGGLTADEVEWCRRWWPLDDAERGDRVEIGLTRDRAWAELVSRVRSGAVLAVDYGHTREHRPRDGTLTAYRAGGLVPPVPDGSCDITAHVAVDSLEHDELTTQREALRGLGLRAGRPDRDCARTDPAAYLAALARSSTLAALTDRAGLGGFWWALRRVHRPVSG